MEYQADVDVPPPQHRAHAIAVVALVASMHDRQSVVFRAPPCDKPGWTEALSFSKTELSDAVPIPGNMDIRKC